ncbi:unnamed protein product [Hymenolepis diminuta]|uniref:PX domain-containing protein n=1 Tax=Hymenolepis diminuta TaxID=6216 RepID=A0A564YKN2_HYMDI|nr:unnamed protein product [Hymenolepis diminuta]
MLVSRDFSVTIPDYDIKDHDFVAYFVQVKALTDKAQILSKGIKSWCVSRRFSEFYRLHEMLKKELPTCLLPPLPPKHDGASSGWYKFASAIGARSVGGQVSLDSIPGAVVGKRFDSDLIDSRRQGLEVFLNRCLSHPRISHSPILRSFLRESEDWTSFLQDSTLAHSLDSYHSLLSLVGEEEAEVEEHLQGHMRYTAAFSDLCAREAAIHRGIAAERAAMLQLQNDVQALQNGTRPEFIPSVVGPVYSMSNNVISGLKSLFLSNDASTLTSEKVSPEEIEKAMEQISKKIEETSIRLAELEEVKSDFKKSMAEEYAFFEKQQSEDLAATMRIYAALQFQRAERCKRLWERAHAAMLSATEPPSISTFSDENTELSNVAISPQSVSLSDEHFRPATLP